MTNREEELLYLIRRFTVLNKMLDDAVSLHLEIPDNKYLVEELQVTRKYVRTNIEELRNEANAVVERTPLRDRIKNLIKK